MKKLLAGLVLSVSLFAPLISSASVYVSGYTKADGTYVAPYYRSDPDGILTNNYSYPGNTNPYTGVTAGVNSCNAYVGSMTEQMAELGIETSAPTQAQGNIDLLNQSCSGTSISGNSASTYAPYTVPQQIGVYIPQIVINRVDDNPGVSCSDLGFTSTDVQNCNTYKNDSGDGDYKIVGSLFVDPSYVSCDGGSTYYLLDSNGNQHVCVATTTAPVTESMSDLNSSMMQSIISMQAEVQAMEAKMTAMISANNH